MLFSKNASFIEVDKFALKWQNLEAMFWYIFQSGCNYSYKWFRSLRFHVLTCQIVTMFCHLSLWVFVLSKILSFEYLFCLYKYLRRFISFQMRPPRNYVRNCSKSTVVKILQSQYRFSTLYRTVTVFVLSW